MQHCKSTLCVLSHVQLFATPCTIAHLASLSMKISREEYWSRLPFPIPRDLPNPEIQPDSLASPVSADRFFPTRANWEAQINYTPIKMLNKWPKKKLPSPYCSYLNKNTRSLNYHCLIVWYWASPQASLRLGFLICNMKAIVSSSLIAMQIKWDNTYKMWFTTIPTIQKALR